MKNFKDSGIEWLGEIPQHWDIVPIRYCFNEFNVRCNDNNYPLLSVTIANGVVYQNDITNKKDTSNDDKSNYKIVPIGAIAYNKMRMWQGAVGINMLEKGIVSPAYIVAIPNKQINISFSYYLLKSKNMISEYEKYSYGLCSDMNNLRYEDFQNIKIPLPPLKEQEQITNFLDEKCEQIKNFIEKKEKLITLLKEQKQAFINEAITKGLDKNVNFKDSGIEYLGEIPQHWKVVKINKMVTFVNGYAFENFDFNPTFEIPVIRIGDIQKEKILYNNCLKTKEKEKLKQFLISNNDILIALSGATTGKIAFCDTDNKAYINQRVAIVRSKLKLVKYYFLTRGFSLLIELACNGSAQPNISIKEIGEFKIPLPPLKEQEQITNFLDEKCKKIDLLIEKTEKQIKLIKEYKTTLINQAVCGRRIIYAKI
ncbi:restriction endonuclease subunit S [Campylobacter sp. RKI_CA19_01122]|uniref:restriction endonuclease subunit S n=1 Tax=Campylobacter sp. RKI_CA19_01122 TaxID=2911627 RepID=UPI0021E7719C|nr:restriction endonuclease subunit S [Campylobacter sp. RKI_CA19_01122]MCV3356100.1 restriction endonuclease subunit S [Campylobacter sp. RKI_CA19_01122]